MSICINCCTKTNTTNRKNESGMLFFSHCNQPDTMKCMHVLCVTMCYTRILASNTCAQIHLRDFLVSDSLLFRVYMCVLLCSQKLNSIRICSVHFEWIQVVGTLICVIFSSSLILLNLYTRRKCTVFHVDMPEK